MKSKLNSMLLLLTFLLLLILMAWPRDSRSEDTPLLCFPGSDAQRLLRIDEEAPLKDQKIALLEQRVSNLEKENDLLKQQNCHPGEADRAGQERGRGLPDRFRERKGTHRSGLEAGRGWETEIELGAYKGYWDWPLLSWDFLSGDKGL